MRVFLLSILIASVVIAQEAKSLFQEGRYSEILKIPNGYSKKPDCDLCLYRSKALEQLSRPMDALKEIQAVGDGACQGDFAEYAAGLNLSFGKFDAAKKFAFSVASKKQLIQKIESLKTKYDSLLRLQSSENEKIVESCNEILRDCRFFSDLMLIKVQALMRQSKFSQALSQLQEAQSLILDQTDIDFLIGKALLASGDPNKALKFVSSCVSLNDERKDCLGLRKYIKHLRAEIESIDGKLLRPSILQFEQLLSEIDKTYVASPYFDPNLPNLFVAFKSEINERLCGKYCKVKDFIKAKETCQELMSSSDDKKSEDAYEVVIKMLTDGEMFEEALGMLTEALKRHPKSRTLTDLQRKVQAAYKKSQKLDYYKILTVEKDATKEQITKAYRKLAQRWHPDKHPNDRQSAEKRMRDINTAFSVLGDPKKRALVDRGIDPEDPGSEQANYQHYHPHEGRGPFGNVADFESIFSQFRHPQAHGHQRSNSRRRESGDGFYYKYDL